MGRALLRVAGTGLASVTLIAGVLTVPGVASATTTTGKLTISASARRPVTGTTIKISGTLTDAGQPVSGSAINVTTTDAIGNQTSMSATTDSSGDWSLPVKITLITTITAISLDQSANQATVKVTAVAKASLKLRPAVGRPYLLDPATVRTAPGNLTSHRLQVRAAGSAKWRAWPDSGGVWSSRHGTIYVRAVAIGTGNGYVAPGRSTQAKVIVRNGKVPAWIKELNGLRALNNAPPVAEDAHLSHGDALHVRYMAKTGDFSHTENRHSRWYTKLGAEAGASSDLFFGSLDPIRGWARAPYHAMAELDRSATVAGFDTDGVYAALWVSSQTSVRTPAGPAFQFPANGKTTSLRTYVGAEIPDPLSSCPKAWYRQIRNHGWVGLPIIFGNQRTAVRPSARFTTGGRALRVCIVNVGYVFVIPLLPLKPHHAYTVAIRYRGVLQSRWRFKVS